MTDNSLEQESCGNCRFFHKNNVRQGVCRKNPPVAVAMGANAQGQVATANIRPAVDEDDWCGEWLPVVSALS